MSGILLGYFTLLGRDTLPLDFKQMDGNVRVSKRMSFQRLKSKSETELKNDILKFLNQDKLSNWAEAEILRLKLYIEKKVRK